jgi:hypothetical protein
LLIVDFYNSLLMVVFPENLIVDRYGEKVVINILVAPYVCLRLSS